MKITLIFPLCNNMKDIYYSIYIYFIVPVDYFITPSTHDFVKMHKNYTLLVFEPF